MQLAENGAKIILKKDKTTLYIEPGLMKEVRKKCVDMDISMTTLIDQLFKAWLQGQKPQNVHPLPGRGTTVVVPDKLAPAVERFLQFLAQEPRDEFMAEMKAMLLRRLGIEVHENNNLKEGNGA